MKKIVTLVIAFVLLMSMAVIPASAADDLTVLNTCEQGNFSASSPMVYGVSDVSPDGVCAEIEYDTAGPVANFKTLVPEAERAADANKEYLCFWIKTPYTECDSGIFVGLFENSGAGATDPSYITEMIWNGHSEKGVYSGQIVTIDKNGEKSYIDATRLLILKPGFEGYVAIPMKTAMNIHTGWKKDKVFDFSKICGIQIWFDGSHAAWDESYFFDNFTLAKDEAAFVSMVESTGLTVNTSSTPVVDNNKEETTNNNNTSSDTDTNNNTSSDTDTNNNTSSDTDTNNNTSVDTNVENTDTDNTDTTTGTDTTNSNNSKITILIIIVVVVLLLAVVAILFIYKPAFLFKKKEEAAAEDSSDKNIEE